jgi:hypothetical protein
VDLLAYLAERHPTVRRVVMAESRSLYDLGRARSSFSFQVHEVLLKPWSTSDLVRVLGQAVIPSRP